MLCVISHTQKIIKKILTKLGIHRSTEASKNILPEKRLLNLTGRGEVVRTAYLSYSSLSQSSIEVLQQCCLCNLGIAFHTQLVMSWIFSRTDCKISDETTFIGIHQLVQTECFELWQPPSSQTGMSCKTACGAPKSTVFGKEVMGFLGCLRHLRRCFIPF